MQQKPIQWLLASKAYPPLNPICNSFPSFEFEQPSASNSKQSPRFIPKTPCSSMLHLKSAPSLRVKMMHLKKWGWRLHILWPLWKWALTIPQCPTSSEWVYMGYSGILWVSMEINGLFRINHGALRPKTNNKGCASLIYPLKTTG